MAEAQIPVDLLNPGQVFACIGLVEAAETLLGGVEAGFDWRDPRAPRFRIRSAGEVDPVAEVLGFLHAATVTALAPEHFDAPTTVGCTRLAPGAPFPCKPEGATLPALLRAGERAIVVDHWGDDAGRDPVKFWAGMGGYPGAALMRDALDLVRGQLLGAAADPFSLAAVQSSSFRLDWRKDYVPIDAGFSLNRHAGIATLGYPLVEILAAIGLTHARPDRLDRLEYRYGACGVRDDGGPLLRPALLRAALGGAELPFPRRTFRMQLTWPGKEGQARSITTVIEETHR